VYDRTLLAWHKEQILTLPGEAEIVSGSSACPYAVLRYGAAALTYQAHPEFTAEFIRGLVATRGQSLPDAVRSKAILADDAEISRTTTHAEIIKFLKAR
jgi:GMP synthase (glutamine-hydrolysing)